MASTSKDRVTVVPIWVTCWPDVCPGYRATPSAQHGAGRHRRSPVWERQYVTGRLWSPSRFCGPTASEVELRGSPPAPPVTGTAAVGIRRQSVKEDLPVADETRVWCTYSTHGKCVARDFGWWRQTHIEKLILSLDSFSLFDHCIECDTQKTGLPWLPGLGTSFTRPLRWI